MKVHLRHSGNRREGPVVELAVETISCLLVRSGNQDQREVVLSHHRLSSTASGRRGDYADLHLQG